MRLFLEILFREPYKFIRFKYYFRFMTYVLRYSAKPRFKTIKAKFGKLKLSVPDPLSFIWQFYEIFVEENYKFTAITKTPIIIDCGANIGLSVLYFKKLFPQSKIFAFEPDDNIFNHLNKNITQNSIKDVTLIKKAVWITNDGVKFFSEGADGSSIFSPRANKKVDSERLKDFIRKFDRIDFLKMDIEGAEIEVMEDCKESLSNISNIFIEYHSFINSKQQLNQLLEILTNAGFRYFIKPEADRLQPFINTTNHNSPNIDLQLNIFAIK